MSKLINFSIPVSIFKENDTFIAYTPVLDISTCADTIEEVRRRFGQLVRIFFEELNRKNTTDKDISGDFKKDLKNR